MSFMIQFFISGLFQSIEQFIYYSLCVHKMKLAKD